jgi:hypothetical protein
MKKERHQIILQYSNNIWLMNNLKVMAYSLFYKCKSELFCTHCIQSESLAADFARSAQKKSERKRNIIAIAVSL